MSKITGRLKNESSPGDCSSLQSQQNGWRSTSTEQIALGGSAHSCQVPVRDEPHDVERGRGARDEGGIELVLQAAAWLGEPRRDRARVDRERPDHPVVVVVAGGGRGGVKVLRGNGSGGIGHACRAEERAVLAAVPVDVLATMQAQAELFRPAIRPDDVSAVRRVDPAALAVARGRVIVGGQEPRRTQPGRSCGTRKAPRRLGRGRAAGPGRRHHRLEHDPRPERAGRSAAQRPDAHSAPFPIGITPRLADNHPQVTPFRTTKLRQWRRPPIGHGQ